VDTSDSPTTSIDQIVDLDRYPLHHPATPAYHDLVEQCREALHRDGLFDLTGLMQPNAINTALRRLRPTIDDDSFTHRRSHNIYFLPHVPGLAPDHPALRTMETVNRTVCADQMGGSELLALYEWAPLRQFLAAATSQAELFVMDDHLARVNVISYRDGEALNWHFDRSEFTTTLLLQQPADGGVFEYRSNLRSDESPNHDAVGRLVEGLDERVRRHHVAPGTLTVFAGHNTAHRVTPTVGARDRVIAVFSYYERPGVTFSDAERIGFYGRT
jgi:hypothetical protein